MRESSAVPALALADARARMLADVRDGLLRQGQKELPPTYFYDARGFVSCTISSARSSSNARSPRVG